tara:strand:+ start:15194 stop:15883 length:690 start_codon:yes stop_codon:yes gene_type:complete
LYSVVQINDRLIFEIKNERMAMIAKSQREERGRPSRFTRSDLVQAVTDMFWREGYKNLSLNHIAKEMGMNRSSFYNTFETKEALFLECLAYYIEKSPTARLKEYKEGQHIGALLYEVFVEICTIRSQDAGNRGCLIVNAIGELAAEDSSIRAFLLKHKQAGEQNMSLLIQSAVKQNELPSDTDVKAFVNTITCFMHGMNMHAKTGASLQDMRAMCHIFCIKIGFSITCS